MKKKTIKVESLELGENVTVLNVDSFEKLAALQTGNDFLVESETSIFLLRQENLAFRFIKPNVKPSLIFTASKLELHPDSFSVKVTIPCKELLDFALKGNIAVFSTETQYVILSGNIFLTSDKPRSDKLEVRK
jgi:hypothetical protein